MLAIALLPVALILGQPLATSRIELPVLILFGAIFALASVTLSEGARRLPSPETALLSALEVPLAPLLAWLILSEPLSIRTAVGGAIILSAIVGSQSRTSL